MRIPRRRRRFWRCRDARESILPMPRAFGQVRATGREPGGDHLAESMPPAGATVGATAGTAGTTAGTVLLVLTRIWQGRRLPFPLGQVNGIGQFPEGNASLRLPRTQLAHTSLAQPPSVLQGPRD